MLLYDENGMSDDRHIRVRHNGFMADTFDLLQLANIVEKLCVACHNFLVIELLVYGRYRDDTYT